MTALINVSSEFQVLNKLTNSTLQQLRQRSLNAWSNGAAMIDVTGFCDE
jgi:hypothetical protein